ncbi:MAG TPA: SDR family NAD(P)-dependent oxidoreductase [Vicinamibacterales bacterium]|jgi:NADP-dependent 3-hydroxy acid dehydrogenase YdfG|nr:SDR family NAD(P)-dependent oxidoreductase [Vicinamibacterales bacterium]
MKVIAITGASAGIGRATALRLARDGHALALCARRLDRLEDVAAEVTRAGGQALPFAADVTSERDMDAFVAATRDRFGRLDVMMCNAGFGIYGTADRVSAADMRRLMDVNYMGTFLAARAALPTFRHQNAGHLVIISSIVGKRGVPYMGPYSATKFAQVGLAECLRSEAQGSPIHVSVVYPISTDTEFFDVMTRESGHATRASGPRQSADAVANAVVRAIARPVPEVYPYRMAWWLPVLNAIAPGVCDRVVKKWGRTPIEGASGG